MDDGEQEHNHMQIIKPTFRYFTNQLECMIMSTTISLGHHGPWQMNFQLILGLIR